jgi:hypothetical protein
MLARERTVTFGNGHELRTPLLVPSISSAGFRRVALESGGSEPEPAAWLRIVHTVITEALLISAYDAAHDNLPFAEELTGESFARSIYAGPRTLIIDCGLYESTYGPPPFEGDRFDWDQAAYTRFVEELDQASKAVLVTYDGYDDDGHAPFGRQIEEAQRFSEAHRGFGSDVLLKPEQRGRRLVVDDLSPTTLASLRAFDVVGFAEKDLGDSLLDKLTNVVTLRQRLTEAEVDAPIHLFGSLDPVMSPLYFAAGAEIFDGLTWLRYGYHWDAAMYREDVPVLEDGQDLTVAGRVRTASMLLGNLKALGVLSERMRQFAVKNDWDIFGDRVGSRLAAAHVALTTRMGE